MPSTVIPNKRPAIAPIARLGTNRPAGTLIPNVNIVNTNLIINARIRSINAF